MGEKPKYSMQYLDMAWDNKYIFTFSRKIEAMSDNKNKNKEAGWRLQIY